MANTTLTQTGQQVQADLDLLDNNNATQGQVLTADGSGGCAWANAGGGGLSGYTLTYTMDHVNQGGHLDVFYIENNLIKVKRAATHPDYLFTETINNVFFVNYQASAQVNVTVVGDAIVISGDLIVNGYNCFITSNVTFTYSSGGGSGD